MASDDLTSDKWYTEIYPDDGAALSLAIKQRIHEEQTEYQYLEIFETQNFGRLMTLDGLVMLTSRDNFIYHEMMTHPALFTHPDPKNIVVIGGGDCGCVKEILKHPVKSVTQIELDERVTRVSEEYFPELCESNNDPRAKFEFTDGIEWMKRADDATLDVIIIDSTDPVGPAAGLFSTEFYQQCFRALTENGVLVAQSESPLFHEHIIHDVHQNMNAAGFSHRALLQFAQCTYPSGWWTASLASKTVSPADFRDDAARQKNFETTYYNADIHRAAMAKPEFLRKKLAD
jgi:spermidine synthase